MNGKNDNKNLIKLAEIEAALEQTVHFMLDGYGDWFSVVRFGFISEYKCTILWGETIQKAMKAVMTDTAKLVEMWGCIRMGIIWQYYSRTKEI